MNDLRQELRNSYIKQGIVQVVYCSNEEEAEFKKLKEEKAPLPSDVYESNSGFHFRYIESDLAEDEVKNLLLFRQIGYLRTIKNSMVFFVVLAIISITFSIITIGMR